MRQKCAPRIIKRLRQTAEAFDFRAEGKSYEQIGKSLNPPVSRQPAWKIINTAMREAEEARSELHQKGIEEFRNLTVHRLLRLIHGLDAKLPNVRAATALLKISTTISRIRSFDWEHGDRKHQI